MATEKNKEEVILDSGERREFESGAVRDIQENKGRCDLLPIREVATLLGMYGYSEDLGEVQVLMDINGFMQTKDVNFLYNAVITFAVQSHTDMCTLMLEVAKHFEMGAKKYTERNWEKGIPLHCYIDSGIRHYIKYLRGDEDERHDRAFVWNMLCAIWTLRNHPELDDLWED